MLHRLIAALEITSLFLSLCSAVQGQDLHDRVWSPITVNGSWLEWTDDNGGALVVPRLGHAYAVVGVTGRGVVVVDPYRGPAVSHLPARVMEWPDWQFRLLWMTLQPGDIAGVN